MLQMDILQEISPIDVKLFKTLYTYGHTHTWITGSNLYDVEQFIFGPEQGYM